MGNTVNSRKFRGGAYATAISFLVILVLVIVNLISGSLFKNVDVTSTGKYSLADETKDFVKSVTMPISLYYVTSEGEEDLIIKTGAELIAEASDMITLTFKDPVQYPQFVYRYNGMQEITNNSIIVVNEDDPDRYAYIDSNEMKVYELDSQKLANLHVGYDAELEIVRAIVEVTTERKATVYAVTNHNEWLTDRVQNNPGQVTEKVSNLMKLNGIKLKYLNLASNGIVPEDCDILILGAPMADLSTDEVKAIENYMTAGGTVILSLYADSDTLPNLQSLLGYYGVRMGSGVVCEGDSSRTIGDTPSVVLCKYNSGDTEWPYSVPLYTDGDVRNTTQITKLMETSKEAYVKPTISDFQKTDGDKTAQFPLLLKIEDTYAGNTGTMYVFSAAMFFYDNFMIANSAMLNREVFVDCMNAGVGVSGEVLSIPNTTAMEERLIMTTNQRNRVALVSFLIPVVVLFIGVVVFLRRRIEKVYAVDTAGKGEE